MTIRNDAVLATTEVVQVYLHDPVAEVARPAQQLIAAARVEPASARRIQQDPAPGDHRPHGGLTAAMAGSAPIKVATSSAQPQARLTPAPPWP